QRSLHAARPCPHPIVTLRAWTPQWSAPLHASGRPSRLSTCAISTADTRRHLPHVLATEAVRLGAPDCSAVMVPEQRGSVRWVWHGLGRGSHVVWGEDNHGNLLSQKGFRSLDFQEDCKEDNTHNPVCEASRQQTLEVTPWSSLSRQPGNAS